MMKVEALMKILMVLMLFLVGQSSRAAEPVVVTPAGPAFEYRMHDGIGVFYRDAAVVAGSDAAQVAGLAGLVFSSISLSTPQLKKIGIEEKKRLSAFVSPTELRAIFDQALGDKAPLHGVLSVRYGMTQDMSGVVVFCELTPDGKRSRTPYIFAYQSVLHELDPITPDEIEAEIMNLDSKRKTITQRDYRESMRALRSGQRPWASIYRHHADYWMGDNGARLNASLRDGVQSIASMMRYANSQQVLLGGSIEPGTILEKNGEMRTRVETDRLITRKSADDPNYLFEWNVFVE